jgi:predicted MFS family arabinose efflux permease
MQDRQESNRNLTLLGAAHSLNHSLFVITPPLLSLITTSLGVTNLEIGLASTIASVTYGTGALFAGPLGNKIGEAKAIAVCLALSGLPAPLMLIAGFTNGFYVYAVTLTIMAAWASLYHPIANSFISKAFKVKVPEAMGIHGVGGTLGVVLTPTAAWFIGTYFGWPWAFIFFGALSVILAVLFAKKATRVEKSNEEKTTIFDALRIRALWLILTLNVAIGLFMKGIELFFPTYLKVNRGIDPMWAAVAYTLLLTCGVPGQWIGGKMCSVTGFRKVMIMAMTGVCIALLSLLFLPTYLIGVGVFIAFYGFFFYSHQPALNALMGILTPYNQRGTVFGIYFFTNFGIGSISQLITGYLSDTYGLDTAFSLLTIFAVAALLLSFRLPEPKDSENDH